MSRKNMKKAGITIEMTLSMILALSVLFLALGLFSNNLKTMAANGGIQNMFNRDNSFAKTAHEAYKRDYTNSQVNVATVGEQGSMSVADYHKQAVEKIAELANKPQPLSDSDRINLAMYLTIYVESSGNDMRMASLSNKISDDAAAILQQNQIKFSKDMTYYDLYDENGITIRFSSDRRTNYCITSVTMTNQEIKQYNWTNDDATSNNSGQIENLNYIKKTFS